MLENRVQENAKRKHKAKSDANAHGSKGHHHHYQQQQQQQLTHISDKAKVTKQQQPPPTGEAMSTQNMSELQRLELKQAFEEFDKVRASLFSWHSSGFSKTNKYGQKI